MDRKQEIQLLKMQIAINERIPPHLRCEEAIADMKNKLAQLRFRPTLVPRE